MKASNLTRMAAPQNRRIQSKVSTDVPHEVVEAVYAHVSHNTEVSVKPPIQTGAGYTESGEPSHGAEFGCRAMCSSCGDTAIFVCSNAREFIDSVLF